MKWAVTRLCRPTGFGNYLWTSRPMFSAVGLFLGLKSKILHEQNVIHFQFYIRLPNCRLLGSIIFKKSPIRSIPLSILYRLFFESQGRKYGRILSWSWLQVLLCFGVLAGKCNRYFIFQFASDWRVNVTGIFLYLSLLTNVFTQLFLCFTFPTWMSTLIYQS